MIVAYIDAYRARFGVEPICAVLTEHHMPIAPSTYYEPKKAPVSAAGYDDAYAVNALLDLHRARRAGLVLGRDQVAQLMATAGMTGARRGRHAVTTTVRDDAAERHPDLVNWKWNAPTAPDQWWVADFTYCWTLAGFVYVSFVIDVFTKPETLHSEARSVDGPGLTAQCLVSPVRR